MVIANPKLSLPTDLPYKKRQRPFNPNTSLQHATIRYNEALRKQYNDTQFAKRYENGYISQNELMSVNTVDIGKNVETELFTEMSNLNPLPIIRQRKSRKIFISCGGTHSSNGEILSTSNKHGSGGNIKGQYYSNVAAGVPICSPPPSIPPLMSLSVNPGENNMGTLNVSVNKGCGDRGQSISKHTQPTIDCNNTEMFPHLLATVGNSNNPEGGGSLPSGTNLNQGRDSSGVAKYSSNTSSNLEAQALNEYVPGVDSAHDMIFGNVMGIQYGNYIHDQLWPTPQQSSSANGGIGNIENCQTYNSSSSAQPHSQSILHSQSPQQNQQNAQQQQQQQPPPQLGTFPTPPSFCGMSKSTGFNLHHHPYIHPYHHFDYDTSSKNVSPLTNAGNIGGGGGSGVQYASATARRSTSVPRPRTGTRKETLKQAAIRCGIIKENQTVPAIPRRSHAHCLFPLQLTPVESDSTVSVVEILHPRTLIPTCSSELLEGESLHKNCPNIPLKLENSCGECNNNNTFASEAPCTVPTSSAVGIDGFKPLKQIRSLADIRTIDNAAASSTSFRSQSDNNL